MAIRMPTVHRYCINASPAPGMGAAGRIVDWDRLFGRGGPGAKRNSLTGQKSLGFSLFQGREAAEQVIQLPKFPEAINFAMISAKAFPICLHCRRGAPGGPIVS
jgi:hypothetical protein